MLRQYRNQWLELCVICLLYTIVYQWLNYLNNSNIIIFCININSWCCGNRVQFSIGQMWWMTKKWCRYHPLFPKHLPASKCGRTSQKRGYGSLPNPGKYNCDQLEKRCLPTNAWNALVEWLTESLLLLVYTFNR